MKAGTNIVASRLSYDMAMDEGSHELRRSMSSVCPKTNGARPLMKSGRAISFVVSGRANSFEFDYDGTKGDGFRSKHSDRKNENTFDRPKIKESQHRTVDSPKSGRSSVTVAVDGSKSRQSATKSRQSVTREISASFLEDKAEPVDGDVVDDMHDTGGQKDLLIASAAGTTAEVDGEITHEQLSDVQTDDNGEQADELDNTPRDEPNAEADAENGGQEDVRPTSSVPIAEERESGIGSSSASANKFDEVFERTFAMLDTDRSGKLSIHEVRTLLQAMGQHYTADDEDRLFRQFQCYDTNDDKELDRKELREAIRDMYQELPERKRDLLTAFISLDLHGTLDREQLRYALQEYGRNAMTDAEFNEVFDDADRNGNGYIEVDELIEFLTKDEDLQPLSA